MCGTILIGANQHVNTVPRCIGTMEMTRSVDSHRVDPFFLPESTYFLREFIFQKTSFFLNLMQLKSSLRDCCS